MPVKEYLEPDQYLEQERAAFSKHDYYKGETVAFEGASIIHNRISATLIARIYNLLQRTGCEVFPGNLRVVTPSKQCFTYPDATIVCDEPDMLDDTFDTLKNPSVIFEIVSPSTEHNDRGRKFFFYMQIPSFSEYFLIDSTSYYIQAGRKQADGSWKFEDIRDLLASLRIDTIQREIPLQEIYTNVHFPAV